MRNMFGTIRKTRGKRSEKTIRKTCPKISGLQKGPAERGHVKKRQISSKSVKKFFDTFRQFSRRAKNVKKGQKVFRHFSTIFARHLFSGPFCNPLKKVKRLSCCLKVFHHPKLAQKSVYFPARLCRAAAEVPTV